MKLSKLFLLIAICMFFVGCTSSAFILDRYKTIDRSDGIDSTEAILLAQNKLILSHQKKNYHVQRASILKNMLVSKYDKYWFVVFESRRYELTFWKYLVVIDKKNGDVIFADTHVPLEQKNYDWVFEK